MALTIEYFDDILIGWEKENQFYRKKKSLNDIAFKYYSCFGIFREVFGAKKKSQFIQKSNRWVANRNLNKISIIAGKTQLIFTHLYYNFK